MKNRLQLSLIGLTFITTIIVAIWGYNYLKGHNLLNPSRIFYVKYDDINGLLNTTPVEVRGYKIGQVSKIEFADKHASYILVTITIESDLDIPKGTKVEIYDSDMLGSKGLRLVFPQTYSELAQDGDTLQGCIAPSLQTFLNDKLYGLYDQSMVLLRRLDSILVVTQKLVSNPNVEKSISDLAVILERTKNITTSIDTMLQPQGSLGASISNLHHAAVNTARFSDTLSNLQLQQTMQKLNLLLEESRNAVELLTSEKGTIGKLTSQDTVYRRLDTILIQMDSLLRDIKEHPHKYVKISVF